MEIPNPKEERTDRDCNLELSPKKYLLVTAEEILPVRTSLSPVRAEASLPVRRKVNLPFRAEGGLPVRANLSPVRAEASLPVRANLSPDRAKLLKQLGLHGSIELCPEGRADGNGKIMVQTYTNKDGSISVCLEGEPSVC